MKQITTKNAIIELTKDELNDLIIYLFDASRWNYDNGFPTLGHKAHQTAMKLWEIEKGLGK